MDGLIEELSHLKQDSTIASTETADECDSIQVAITFKCEMCSKEFSSGIQLQQHEASKPHRKRAQDVAKTAAKMNKKSSSKPSTVSTSDGS